MEFFFDLFDDKNISSNKNLKSSMNKIQMSDPYGAFPLCFLLHEQIDGRA